MEPTDKVLHEPVDCLDSRHKAEHEGYEYTRRYFVRRGEARKCVVSVYEIPPGKSAYPYHYHVKDEETFYIISGEGTLRTPGGERTVRAGELLFFPAGEGGAHKLTNTGEGPLTYIDFDAVNDLDAAVYPDSGKLGVWGMGVNQVFRLEDEAGYYEGE
ncbi:cupin domain-containing protein [Acutalibacter sp.]|uniref:cupin domain-containing protein n=1 Tax=Acutalibacter sp. TaxID=1918636 RepID=UPI0025C1D496|nr:cupin domain-containing protein [Acutalibacter sp.]